MEIMIAALTQVFDSIGSWIIKSLGSMTQIFWADSQFTFLGLLAVCGLAFSVVFLIIGIIQRFLHFRG